MATVEAHPKVVSADEYVELDLPAPTELVRGEIVELSRPGEIHCAVCATIVFLLKRWARENNCTVFSNDAGVLTATDPDTVRGPDVAVRARQSLTPHAMRVPPRLVVEVVSPSNSRAALLIKIGEYFQAGVAEAWLVDPQSREAEVFRPEPPVRRIVTDGLFETDILPGFSVPIAACFEDLDD